VWRGDETGRVQGAEVLLDLQYDRVPLPRRDADAAPETRVVGHELVGHREPLGHRVELPNLDVRAAAGAGAGNQFRPAVAVQVAGRDVDAAGEPLVVGHELGHHPLNGDVSEHVLLQLEDLDVRTAAGHRPRDQVIR